MQNHPKLWRGSLFFIEVTFLCKAVFVSVTYQATTSAPPSTNMQTFANSGYSVKQMITLKLCTIVLSLINALCKVWGSGITFVPSDRLFVHPKLKCAVHLRTFL